MSGLFGFKLDLYLVLDLFVAGFCDCFVLCIGLVVVDGFDWVLVFVGGWFVCFGVSLIGWRRWVVCLFWVCSWDCVVLGFELRWWLYLVFGFLGWLCLGLIC